jgi:thioredoxin-like negative regulator of GroEL
MGNPTMREPSSSAAAGADQLINMVKSAIKSTPSMASKIMKALQDAGTASGAAMRAESKDLKEALNTISTLRSELNEVNLLNAKLLYVNKLFKAKNLNESQKVKVINAFDRAETVREAKNVYDTLSESLSTEKAKSQIKESLSFASKAAGVSDRKPIMENIDSTTARWQKLAGIIK